MVKKYEPGSSDINGKPIPRYIIHGGPEVAEGKGLPTNECQFITGPITSDEHKKNREAMFKRWVEAGAEHVYP